MHKILLVKTIEVSANKSNNYWNNGGYEVVAVGFMDVLGIFVEK